MNEMIERCAAAIDPKAFRCGPGFHQERRRDKARRTARAVIADMREPTDAMLKASWEATRRVSAETRAFHAIAIPEQSHKAKAAHRWRAMIDEALR